MANIALVDTVFSVIFSDDRASVLLIKRRDIPIWTLPGGGVDPGEEPEIAAAREAKEETGLSVEPVRLVGDYLPINRLSKRTHIYECRPISGDVSLSSETSDIRFFPLNDLPPTLFFLYKTWIMDTSNNSLPVRRKLTEITYRRFFLYLVRHPIYIIRFLLSRAGFPINRRL